MRPLHFRSTDTPPLAAPVRAALAAVGLISVVALAGCSGGSATATNSAGRADAQSAASGEPTGTPRAAAPAIAITPADGAANVRLDTPVKVGVDTGSLDSVAVHTDASTAPIAGAMAPDGKSWIATGGLDPKVRYIVEAAAHSSGGSSSAQAAFSTIAVSGKLTTDAFPGDGAVVGIGMPIILKFNQGVPAEKQVDFVKHLQVQSSVPVTGAWHWFGTQEVHWRPQDYWPPNTKVTINAHLRGVEASSNVWGVGDWTSTFTIGEKHISVIDAAAHSMEVFSNDQLIHTYPISAGKPSSPTISGTLFVWYKLQQVKMVSTSIGIPVNAPGGYDETVFWDTAISTDGFYIHSAPWSVGSQGNTNVSHGCVNLSPDRATEFFKFSQVGDIVLVKGTSRVADYSDGEADWQIPFAQYANSGGVTGTPPPAAAPGGGGL